MTTEHAWLPAVTVDLKGLALAVLLLSVTIGSVALVPHFQATPEDGGAPVEQNEQLADRSASEQAAAGGGWAVLEAVFAGVVLVLALLWKRLPEWVQDMVKDTVAYGIFLVLGGAVFAPSSVPLWKGTVAVLGLYVVAETVDELGLWWVVNNLLALGIAVYIGAFGGIRLGIPFVAVGLVGLAVYDHYFANQQSWMFTIGGALLRLRLPVLVILPHTLRFDWGDMIDAVEDPDSDAESFAFGLGMADLMLPAMFAAAVAAYPVGTTVAGWPVALLGVMGGIALAAFRLRWEIEHQGSGAGLPALTAGAVGGWVVAVAVVSVAVVGYGVVG